MQAGKLNRRITFQAETITYNSINEPISAWVDLATIWAQALTTGSREFYAAQKLYAETAIVFRIHFSNRYSSKMRIKYGDRYFHLLGEPQDPDGLRKELLISAKEVA